MKFGRKLTVSLLSVLMLSGIGASGVNASTRAHSNAQLVRELETRPKVQKANHVKKAKPTKRHRRHKVTAKNAKLAKKQTRRQNKAKRVMKKVHKQTTKKRARKHVSKRVAKGIKKSIRKPRRAKRAKRTNWFNDGLSRRDLIARNWVTSHESGHRWNILSYGGVCVGYFQLSPGYLGYKNGHVNLDHAHQVKVADHYAKTRYGGWVNAQRFWASHNWY